MNQQQFSPARQQFSPARQQQSHPGFLANSVESVRKVLSIHGVNGSPPTSEDHPEFIVANLTMSEQNRPFYIQQIFDVAADESGQKYDTIEIWLPVHPMDSKHQWTCWLHPYWNEVVGQFRRSAVMVRGPSQDATFRTSGKYIHSGKEETPFKKSKERHQETTNKIENEAFRQYTYYLIIFPKGMYFDNQIFSKHAFKVQDHQTATKAKESGTINATIYWQITVDGTDRDVGCNKERGQIDFRKLAEV